MQTALRNDTLQFDPELHRPRPHRSGPASGDVKDRSMPAGDPVAVNCCPYLERDDERCQARFSLGRLSEAMDVCLGSGVAGCLMYHRLRMEEEQGQWQQTGISKYYPPHNTYMPSEIPA